MHCIILIRETYFHIIRVLKYLVILYFMIVALYYCSALYILLIKIYFHIAKTGTYFFIIITLIHCIFILLKQTYFQYREIETYLPCKFIIYPLLVLKASYSL